jgi:hypothetical protein
MIRARQSRHLTRGLFIFTCSLLGVHNPLCLSFY